MLAGLADGTVDAIATDHAPHHADEKHVEFDRAPFGIVGLETAVSLRARPARARRRHHAARGSSSCCRSTRRGSSTSPAARSPPGAPADITILAPDLPIDGRRVDVPVEVAEHAVRRLDAARGGVAATIVGGPDGVRQRRVRAPRLRARSRHQRERRRQRPARLKPRSTGLYRDYDRAAVGARPDPHRPPLPGRRPTGRSSASARRRSRSGASRACCQSIERRAGGDGAVARGVRPPVRPGARRARLRAHRPPLDPGRRPRGAAAGCCARMLDDVGIDRGVLPRGRRSGRRTTSAPRSSRSRARALALDLRPAYGRVPRRPGVRYFFPRPSAGSACKRLNLFLRWMVRRDAIDLGVWSRVSPSQLDRAARHPRDPRRARCLGLTRYRSPGWKMAAEITASLRAIDPADPVRYDFSLCHVGMRDRLRLRRDLRGRTARSGILRPTPAGCCRPGARTRPASRRPSARR